MIHSTIYRKQRNWRATNTDETTLLLCSMIVQLFQIIIMTISLGKQLFRAFFLSLYWFLVFSRVMQFTFCRIKIGKDWPKHWNSFRSSWCWCVVLDYYCYHCIYIKVNVHLNYIFYFNYYESKLWKSIKNLIASDFQYTPWWKNLTSQCLIPVQWLYWIDCIEWRKKPILTSCCVTI